MTDRLGPQLAALPSDLRAFLSRRGFTDERLLGWASTLGEGRDARNRLVGEVEPPLAGDVAEAAPEGSAEHARLAKIGLAALCRGEVALCLLSGGMATRMGGVVKALVEVLPGKTFLDLRIGEHDHLEGLAGAPVPLWLMTSSATDMPLRAALGHRLDGERVATFEQFVSLRLTPEGDLFLGEDGRPEPYATGHGDLPDALRHSGLLRAFRARGGRFVWIANIDNLGATVDCALLGRHIEASAPLTVELVDKAPGDRGGGPVRHQGRVIIAEEFRLPASFDPTRVPVFNTNTFLIDADALDEPGVAWTYVEVEKTVDGRRAVQFERLLGELTTGPRADYLRVPRVATASRFLPVKDRDELERRRGEIAAVVGSRGMV